MKLLQQQMEAIDSSADKAMRDTQIMFNQLHRLVEKRSSDVQQQIRFQQQTELSWAKELQKKLQQEVTDLRRRDAELEQLSRTEDHGQFLLSYALLSGLSESTHSASINIHPQSYFQEVTAAVSDLVNKLQCILSQDWSEVLLTEGETLLRPEQHKTLVKQQMHLVPPPPPSLQPPTKSRTLVKQQPCLPPPQSFLSPVEPTTRAEFLQYSKRITMDPNTAHRELLLSEGHRRVTFGYTILSYSDNPERFRECAQILSREILTGCCYWEVKWKRFVSIAVAYKCISRTGSDSEFGYNDKSWSLECDCNSYKFRHNNIVTFLSVPQCSRVGVYLDHSDGILCFYSVSETMTLIHRVQTTFTQPLHAGLWVDISGSAEFVELQYTCGVTIYVKINFRVPLSLTAELFLHFLSFESHHKNLYLQ